MTIDIRQLLEKAHQYAREKKKSSEADKAGHPRIGSAGAVSATGDLYGTCPRIGHLRLLGIEQEPETHTEIMWRAGEWAEENFVDLIKPVFPHLILRHADCAVRWKVEGVPKEILGHPDVVLADEHGVPMLGIELKSIFGLTTGVSTELEGRPKTENLCQAGSYAKVLGIPYVLLYTNASWLSPNFYQQKEHGVKHIKPFYKIFYLSWKDGRLYYRDESKAEDVRTEITEEGIEDYYRLLFEIGEQKQLPPRPEGMYADGKKAKWGPCGICDWKDLCDKYENDYEAFIEGAKNVSTKKIDE